MWPTRRPTSRNRLGYALSCRERGGLPGRAVGAAGLQGCSCATVAIRFSGVPFQVGRAMGDFVGKSVLEQYIMSLYFAVSLFAAIGDPALNPQTHLELAMTIVYLVSAQCS
jgi:hypothetical protein